MIIKIENYGWNNFAWNYCFQAVKNKDKLKKWISLEMIWNTSIMCKPQNQTPFSLILKYTHFVRRLKRKQIIVAANQVVFIALMKKEHIFISRLKKGHSIIFLYHQSQSENKTQSFLLAKIFSLRIIESITGRCLVMRII